MIKNKDSLIQPDGYLSLWRYMNFAKFYDLLINKSLFFSRLDRYPDSFEGTLHESTKEELYKYRKEFLFTSKREAEDWTKSELANIESYKALILSNSWSLSEEEDYALWKVYLSGSKEGVAIRTTVDKFNEALDGNRDFEIHTSKVTYEPVKREDLNIFTVATNKRGYYRYENEYRALIHAFVISKDGYGKQTKNARYENGTNVKVDLRTLIDYIYISPFVESWFDEIIKSLSAQYLNFLQPDKIKKSGIRDE